MSKTRTIGDTRREIWLTRVASALRTTLACTIVGCTSLYGPRPVRRYLEFPAFSYVTTILILSEAKSLGDTLRGCCHVICATLQAFFLSTLCLHLIGPSNFTESVAAAAVAGGAFVVGLPESTHLMTKRIAFGQLVIVHVSTVIHGAEEAGILVHPIHVAASTALGALASVLAMLFPYPRLACCQIRNAHKLYVAHASKRLIHSVDAISAFDNSIALDDFFTEAKSLYTQGAKLLQCIGSNLDGMRWERPHKGIFDPNCGEPLERLQDMEIPIRGMEIALSSFTSFNVSAINEDLRKVLLDYKALFLLKLDQQAKFSASFDAASSPDSKKEILNCFSGCAKNLYKDLPTSFFMYCMELLIKDSPIARNIQNMAKKTQKIEAFTSSSWRIREFVMNMLPRRQNLEFAFKCSLSLGLAVLFGLTYNKENGYWSGLTIAISFGTEQATFSVSNARGQGTAMGSIYGILCCFMFQKLVDLRFLPLLPWVVFSCFLMHSRMYGQAGGISAVIGALLILGRKHYGSPTQFAIARITEATIGLICFIAVELLVHPTRAASLAKSELSQCLRSLQGCIDGVSIISPSDNEMLSLPSQALYERQKKLKSVVSQLEKYTSEAELEPNFWFLPFQGACYRKLLESFSRMVDLLLFVAYSTAHVPRMSEKDGVIWRNLQDRVKENIELFKNKVDHQLKFLEEITRMKSLSKLEKELKNTNLPCDIESGKHLNTEVNSITDSFLQHMEEMASTVHANNHEETLKGHMMIFHYSCLGFCIISLMRETIKIENQIKELLLRENPSSEVNLNEIYCKINVMLQNKTSSMT